MAKSDILIHVDDLMDTIRGTMSIMGITASDEEYLTRNNNNVRFVGEFLKSLYDGRNEGVLKVSKPTAILTLVKTLVTKSTEYKMRNDENTPVTLDINTNPYTLPEWFSTMIKEEISAALFDIVPEFNFINEKRSAEVYDRYRHVIDRSGQDVINTAIMAGTLHPGEPISCSLYIPTYISDPDAIKTKKSIETFLSDMAKFMSPVCDVNFTDHSLWNYYIEKENDA